MRNKLYYLFFVFLLGCTLSDEQREEFQNLAEVISLKSSLERDEVIACAASKRGDDATSFIYYYPIPEARNIRYFETNSVDVDPNDFHNYEERILPSEPVFGGYLERFVRQNKKEVFCIVTFETNGRFHKSNPIRLKNVTKPTEYTNEVTIDFSQELMPHFAWEDGIFPENAIYFQVIADNNNNFISGTYTFDKWFQYYKLSNVVLDINREIPENLITNEQYHFNMLGVSLDNWVNIFIPNINFIGQ